MRTLVALVVGSAAALLGGTSRVANAYPMILEIPEETERCLRLTIPQGDDAHVVFVALPGLAAEEEQQNPDWAKEQREMEEHFVYQMAEMQKFRVRSALPLKFPNEAPERIRQLMGKFLHDQNEGEHKSGCKITVTNPTSTATRNMESSWFTPVVLNHVRKAIRTPADVGNENPLEGFELCFENTSDESPIQMLIESVVMNDPGVVYSDDETPAFESSHLTPLAEQLADSIDAANSVLNEMRYMEGRERRMRQTADSINARVRYFSYISVTVLIVVTYLQVTYLKRYFRKKKLL